MREAQTERSDLRHYLRLAWRHKWLLLTIVVAIPAAVYAISTQISKVYEAKTTVFVQSTTITAPGLTTPISVSSSSPADVARLIETPVVAEIAAKKLDIPASESRSLLGGITVQAEGTSGNESDFLSIFARAGDPEEAADTAAAFARAITSKRTKQAVSAIDDTISGLSAEAGAVAALSPIAKAELDEQLQTLRALRETQAGATQVVDPAFPPTTPISPKPRRNAVLGLIFALLLAAGLVPLLDRLDVKLRRPDEIEELGAAPMLAMVPTEAFPGKVAKPHVREAFQTLRAGLTSFHVDRALATLAVTSPGRGDGKTTVATNLAVALAQDRRDVILVDGDLRRGDAAERLGVRSGAGLEAVLLGERGLQEALVEVEGVHGGRLRVLPAGTPPPNPSVLLGSQRMQSVLAELSELSDIVVLDTPPLLTVSDALPLFEDLSGTIVVARVDYTSRDAVRKTVEVLAAAKARILGGVVTGARGGGLYGYDVSLEGYEAEAKSDEDLTLVPETGNGAGEGRGPLGRLRDRTRRRAKAADRD